MPSYCSCVMHKLVGSALCNLSLQYYFKLFLYEILSTLKYLVTYQVIVNLAQSLDI